MVQVLISFRVVGHEVPEVIAPIKATAPIETTSTKRKLSIDSPAFFNIICGRNGIRVSKPVEDDIAVVADEVILDAGTNDEEKVALMYVIRIC